MRIALVLVVTLVAAPAWAGLIAYAPMEDTNEDGRLANWAQDADTGGSGWTAGWYNESDYDDTWAMEEVKANLTHPNLPMASSGGSANHGAYSKARARRDIATTGWESYLDGGAFGKDGTTIYVSYLLEYHGPIYPDAGLVLTSDTVTGDGGNASPVDDFWIGLKHNWTGTSGQYWAHWATSAGRLGDPIGINVTDMETKMLVAKIEFGAGDTAGNEKVTLWVDPTDELSAPIGVQTDVASFQFSGIRVSRLYESLVDEAYIGTAMCDVVVPEPATLSLLALGAAALIRRRK
jgi:PEP-CTERM motif-containing protein